MRSRGPVQCRRRRLLVLLWLVLLLRLLCRRLLLAMSRYRVTPPVVQQVGDPRRLGVQHLMLPHWTHHTVIVTDPRGVGHIVHVRNVVSLGGLLSVMVHHSKQLVLLLLRLVLLRGEDF